MPTVFTLFASGGVIAKGIYHPILKALNLESFYVGVVQTANINFMTEKRKGRLGFELAPFCLPVKLSTTKIKYTLPTQI